MIRVASQRHSKQKKITLWKVAVSFMYFYYNILAGTLQDFQC